MYSDVGATIAGTISGATDSIIHVGDTVKVSIKIPDTLYTNYGAIAVKGFTAHNKTIGLSCGGADSIIPEGAFLNSFFPPEIIKKGFKYRNSANANFDVNSRTLECWFMPDRKGKYVIEASNGLVDVRATNGQEWAVNIAIQLNQPKRYQQYLGWFEPNVRASVHYPEGMGFYWFEVK